MGLRKNRVPLMEEAVETVLHRCNFYRRQACE